MGLKRLRCSKEEATCHLESREASRFEASQKPSLLEEVICTLCELMSMPTISLKNTWISYNASGAWPLRKHVVEERSSTIPPSETL